MNAITYEIADLISMLPQFVGVTSRGFEVSIPVSLSRSERRTLMHLRNFPGETMCFYSHKVGLSQASMTSVADRLAQKGLVERQSTENDRRSYTLSLTKSGAEIAQMVHEQFVAFIAQKVSVISDEDQKAFRGALHTMKRLMETMNQQ